MRDTPAWRLQSVLHNKRCIKRYINVIYYYYLLLYRERDTPAVRLQSVLHNKHCIKRYMSFIIIVYYYIERGILQWGLKSQLRLSITCYYQSLSGHVFILPYFTYLVTTFI